MSTLGELFSRCAAEQEEYLFNAGWCITLNGKWWNRNVGICDYFTGVSREQAVQSQQKIDEMLRRPLRERVDDLLEAWDTYMEDDNLTSPHDTDIPLLIERLRP